MSTQTTQGEAVETVKMNGMQAINAALEGLPREAISQQLQQAVRAALGPDVQMYGLTVEGIAVVVQRALA